MFVLYLFKIHNNKSKLTVAIFAQVMAQVRFAALLFFKLIMAVSPDELREMYATHARASSVFNDHELEITEKLAEAFKMLTNARALEMVERAGQQPILFSYQSDATSNLVNAGCQVTSAGSRVKRVGRALTEYLMERGHLHTISAADNESMRLIFHDPTPLNEGKTVWHEFTAMTKFFKQLKSIGHRGISITHFIADRAVFISLFRKLVRLHDAFFDPHLNPNQLEDAHLQELLD